MRLPRCAQNAGKPSGRDTYGPPVGGSRIKFLPTREYHGCVTHVSNRHGTDRDAALLIYLQPYAETDFTCKSTSPSTPSAQMEMVLTSLSVFMSGQ